MNTNVEKVEYPSFDCIFTGLDMRDNYQNFGLKKKQNIKWNKR